MPAQLVTGNMLPVTRVRCLQKHLKYKNVFQPPPWQHHYTIHNSDSLSVL